jgi:aryl-alcohol dehydrogenase-like predicted oxidoreductase
VRYTILGNLEVSRIGLGCMPMSALEAGAGSDDAESMPAIHRALDLALTDASDPRRHGTDDTLATS